MVMPATVQMDFKELQKTLHDLKYTEKLSIDSVPLIKHILFDYYELIKNFNRLHASQKYPSVKCASEGGSVDLDESYIFRVVDGAKNQNEHLHQELARLQMENQELRNQVYLLRSI